MAKPIMKFNKWRRKKKGLLGSRIQWYRVLERRIFKKMPLRRDWVFIESFFGKSYSDSPKYLYEYLQKTRGDKYRYIWVLNKKSPALAKSGKHTRVKMNSLRYVYYASRVVTAFSMFASRLGIQNVPVLSFWRPGMERH